MTRATRELESREHEAIQEYDMDYENPFSLPPGVAKEGYSYAWINTDIKGVDSRRVEEMSRKLWTIVPADRFPHSNYDPLDRNPLTGKGALYKDLILMERPKHYLQRENHSLQQTTENQLKSLRGVTTGENKNNYHVINSF